MHSDELLVSGLMLSQGTWTRFDHKSDECTKMRCVLATNGIERDPESFIDSQGVPVVEDKNMDATDLMKCLKALEKVEQTVDEVLFSFTKILDL
jgi:hypothetical protein